MCIRDSDAAYANPEKSAGNSWNEFSVKSPSRDKYSEKNTQGVLQVMNMKMVQR